MPEAMRDILIKELNLAVRTLRDEEALVPRFRITSGDGNFVILAARQKCSIDQRKLDRLVKGFMLLTLARWFVFSTETKERDGVASFLIARNLQLAATRRFRRGTRRLGPIEWLDAAAIEQDIIEFLPKRSARMSRKLYRDLMLCLRTHDVDDVDPSWDPAPQ